jgi:hypothetical protein
VGRGNGEARDGEVRLDIGRLERWLLSLCGIADDVVESPFGVRQAADAISQSRHDVVAPLVGRDRVLPDECYTRAGNDWLDRLPVLAAIEIVAQLRGHGIGARASARSIPTLTRDECTLITTKAAPLDASDFRSDPDSDHDLTLTSKPRGTRHRSRWPDTATTSSGCSRSTPIHISSEVSRFAESERVRLDPVSG